MKRSGKRNRVRARDWAKDLQNFGLNSGLRFMPYVLSATKI